MEMIWLIVTIIASVLAGLLVWTFIPACAIIQFYILHAIARAIERNCSCCLRWSASIFHVFAYLTARCIQFYGWLMHSYEVVGEENIPTDRPVLLIFYHGVMLVDVFYFVVKLYFKKRGVLRVVANKCNFGIACLLELMKNYTFHGPVERCVSTLQSGHSIIIAPGGMRESQFATLKYETLWNNRTGFARVAREAKVDIVPIFTRNIRQWAFVPECLQRNARQLYENKRITAVFPLPVVFPVKFVTYVGNPIPYDSVDSAEELAKLTQGTIDSMIKQYQYFPTTFWRGIWERFTKVQPLNSKNEPEKVHVLESHVSHVS